MSYNERFKTVRSHNNTDGNKASGAISELYYHINGTTARMPNQCQPASVNRRKNHYLIECLNILIMVFSSLSQHLIRLRHVL